jgi:tetratricopeptide (TPR) repeat protein
MARVIRCVQVVTVAAILLTMVSCLGSADNSAALERHKKLAGELRDSKLYEAAIEEYKKLLDYPDVEVKTRGNINYLIGKIYYENLNDFDRAAAYYIRARALDPDGSYINEASKNLVASLEKMGQMLDAKRQLGAATDLEAAPERDGDVAVARVGGVPIWLSQVEEELQTLPTEVQKQFTSRQAKVEYVHQYVAVELLYRAALREAYDDDPDVKRQQRLLLRKLLVDKYVLDKVMPQVTIDTVDVRNFYVANKNQKYSDAPYDSVKAQVFLDYQAQKANAAFSDYISMLSRAEKVEFYEQNVK